MTYTKSERTIVRIMVAAMQHFARNGHEGTRMDLITGSQVRKLPVLSVRLFARQPETVVLNALKSA